MKLIVPSFHWLNICTVAVIVIAFGACNVMSIEPLGSENNISFENIYPNSIENANTILTGSGTRSWSSNSFTIEGISGFQPCRLDDQIVMNMDGSFSYDGGDVLCGAEDNMQIKSGSWNLNYTTRTLTFVPNTGDPVELYIEMLTDQEVVFSANYIGLDILGKLSKN